MAHALKTIRTGTAKANTPRIGSLFMANKRPQEGEERQAAEQANSQPNENPSRKCRYFGKFSKPNDLEALGCTRRQPGYFTGFPLTLVPTSDFITGAKS